ncbi:MAG: nuclease-related domain-containing protein, partial [Candidatus Promineifilaceae bacterium]
MARMYPHPMRPDTDSRAEVLLYDLFEKELPDTYHVFHSVAWQSRTAGHFRRDGEADFVIVHPDKGILVLEAKAGQIDYDGRTGKWTQNNHDMGKDPFEQAKGSLYHLRDTLNEEYYWRERDIAFGHAVAFTDVVAPTTPISLQAPGSIILDKRNLQDVEAWVANAFEYYRGGRKRNGIDAYGMGYIVDLLAPVRELRSLIGIDIKDEQKEFIRLTEEQFSLLDFL